MAAPILTPALVSLRSGFNGAYPDRSTASDGWIGNAAHQQTTSGHNPDDTPGVSAERGDADSIPEVRAIDVDVDLIPARGRAASRLAMLREIKRIISTPQDRRRLIYIIFDGLIWSASRGWEPHEYTGENQHREHAHFSGHPDYDNDRAPWSVQTGDNVTPAEFLKLLQDTVVSSPSLGTFTVEELLKKSENARREAQAAKDNATAAERAANTANTSAFNAQSEASLAREAATRADASIARVESKVDELLARPPVVLDYRELAIALLQVIREEESSS